MLLHWRHGAPRAARPDLTDKVSRPFPAAQPSPAPRVYRPPIQRSAAPPPPRAFNRSSTPQTPPPVYRPTIQRQTAPPAPAAAVHPKNTPWSAPPVYRPSIQQRPTPPAPAGGNKVAAKAAPRS